MTLDGQPMKCRVEGLAAADGSGGATIKLPEALRKKKKVGGDNVANARQAVDLFLYPTCGKGNCM